MTDPQARILIGSSPVAAGNRVDASAPWARRSAIDVLAAVQQPLDASNAALELLNTQASHQQQHLQATEVQAQSAPRMG